MYVSSTQLPTRGGLVITDIIQFYPHWCTSTALIAVWLTQPSTLSELGNEWRLADTLGEGLVWLIGAEVCLHAAPQIQLFTGTGCGWPRNVLYMYWRCRENVFFLFLHAKADTALARLSHRNSVCLSLRLFVCHTSGSVKNGAGYNHQFFTVDCMEDSSFRNHKAVP